MRIGDTFLGALPGETLHLWVVITPPNVMGEVVIVNFTTNRCDETCKIAPGDHSFVTKPTGVRYQDARLIHASLLQKALDRGILQSHHPVSEALLKRIQQGALASPFTPGKIASQVARALGG